MLPRKSQSSWIPDWIPGFLHGTLHLSSSWNQSYDQEGVSWSTGCNSYKIKTEQEVSEEKKPTNQATNRTVGQPGT